MSVSHMSARTSHLLHWPVNCPAAFTHCPPPYHSVSHQRIARSDSSLGPVQSSSPVSWSKDIAQDVQRTLNIQSPASKQTAPVAEAVAADEGLEPAPLVPAPTREAASEEDGAAAGRPGMPGMGFGAAPGAGRVHVPRSFDVELVSDCGLVGRRKMVWVPGQRSYCTCPLPVFLSVFHRWRFCGSNQNDTMSLR